MVPDRWVRAWVSLLAVLQLPSGPGLHFWGMNPSTCVFPTLPGPGLRDCVSCCTHKRDSTFSSCRYTFLTKTHIQRLLSIPLAR